MALPQQGRVIKHGGGGWCGQSCGALMPEMAGFYPKGLRVEKEGNYSLKQPFSKIDLLFS